MMPNPKAQAFDRSAPPESPAPPGAGLNFSDPAVVADLFDKAATANLESRTRLGSSAHLPATGNLIISGDLHDHGLNFMRLLKLAALHKSPDNHLILHEIVHGPAKVNGRDLSVRSLARVAALKVQYPDQVHIMLANHELAQLNGENILKDGQSVVQAFDEGVEFVYGDGTGQVLLKMHRFIRSMLLAVRCTSGLFISHSLPSPRHLERFDPAVIDREPTDEDLKNGGSAYMMVWGRNHNRAVTDALGKAWGAQMFVMGHQPAEMGYDTVGDCILILASDHDHGMALRVDVSKSYTLDELVGQMIPLASVVM